MNYRNTFSFASIPLQLTAKTLKSKRSLIICLQGWWERGKLVVLCFKESRNGVDNGSFCAWGRGQVWSPKAACTQVLPQGITLERPPFPTKASHLSYSPTYSCILRILNIYCVSCFRLLCALDDPGRTQASNDPSFYSFFFIQVIFLLILWSEFWLSNNEKGSKYRWLKWTNQYQL